MNYDLGLQGLALLIIPALLFGLVAQLIVWRSGTHWMWLIGAVAWIVGAGDPIDEFFDLSTWIASIIGAFVILAVYSAVGGTRTSRRIV